MSIEISPSQLGSQQHCVSAQACGKGKSPINKERRERERDMVIRVETPVKMGRSPKKRGHLLGSAYEKAGQVSKKTWPFAPKLVTKWAGVKKNRGH
jgi:hypothetical protein